MATLSPPNCCPTRMVDSKFTIFYNCHACKFNFMESTTELKGKINDQMVSLNGFLESRRITVVWKSCFIRIVETIKLE